MRRETAFRKIPFRPALDKSFDNIHNPYRISIVLPLRRFVLWIYASVDWKGRSGILTDRNPALILQNELSFVIADFCDVVWSTTSESRLPQT